MYNTCSGPLKHSSLAIFLVLSFFLLETTRKRGHKSVWETEALFSLFLTKNSPEITGPSCLFFNHVREEIFQCIRFITLYSFISSLRLVLSTDI